MFHDLPSSRGSRASRHPPSTHHPPADQPATTAVQQQWSSTYRTNPQRQHSSTPVRTTAVHLWYARSWVGFALSFDSPPQETRGGSLFYDCLLFRGSRASRHLPSTRHPLLCVDQLIARVFNKKMKKIGTSSSTCLSTKCRGRSRP